ncbi:MAG: crossover junction endodeoxyribonuclease RuvC [Planctomycetaceae bacterium]|nr:crossover junction endodeoxyribonuclease RuvC [Planctomycetaceae bacterium]
MPDEASLPTNHLPRVLGVDPGLNITGYGVLEQGPAGPALCEAGVVRSRSAATLETRLNEIYQGMREVLLAFTPQAMAVEELYSHYERPRTAILMGHARGVICLAAAEARIPVYHYAATQVKRLLTGSGRATKQQMQQAICRELSLSASPEPPDVADALAIALCHHYLAKRSVLLS